MFTDNVLVSHHLLLYVSQKYLKGFCRPIAVDVIFEYRSDSACGDLNQVQCIHLDHKSRALPTTQTSQHTYTYMFNTHIICEIEVVNLSVSLPSIPKEHVIPFFPKLFPIDLALST